MANLRTVVDALAVEPVRWTPAVRIVPRFPRIEVLEQFDAALQAAVLAELATVDPDAVGNLRLLPPGPPPTGPGASHLITCYTFCRAGRFNDDSFAAFYGADSLATAIRETVHHLAASLEDCNAPAQTLPPRLVLHVDVDATDVVNACGVTDLDIYDPDDYAESRQFGMAVRDRGYQGILYASVRRPGGKCIAVYDPAALSGCREDRELIYHYDNGAVHVSEMHYRSGA